MSELPGSPTGAKARDQPADPDLLKADAVGDAAGHDDATLLVDQSVEAFRSDPVETRTPGVARSSSRQLTRPQERRVSAPRIA